MREVSGRPERNYYRLRLRRFLQLARPKYANGSHSWFVPSRNGHRSSPADAKIATGAPPAWTPVNREHQLKEDQGDFFRDPNAARIHRPLEPAVRALLTQHKDFDGQEIELFACSSTLGNVLRFARRIEQRFRFLVQVVGNTVFFLRQENSPTQLIEGVRGFGHTFPDANTQWDAGVEGSVSHQRLLRYRFAGLNCLVRSGCDGYIPSKAPEAHDALQTSIVCEERSDGNDDVPLHKVLASSPREIKDRTAPLKVTKTGHEVPQAAIFDLKTRGSYSKSLDVLQDQLPRLWLAQIPNFILAYHDRGMFVPEDVHVQDVQKDLHNWEQENQQDIKQFGWLLREIIAAARARKDGKLEVYRKELHKLELREQHMEEHVLPVELILRWTTSAFANQTGSADDKPPQDSDEGSTGTAYSDARSYVESYGPDSDLDPLELSDDESEKDYTACSAEDCGYCGHCSY